MGVVEFSSAMVANRNSAGPAPRSVWICRKALCMVRMRWRSVVTVIMKKLGYGPDKHLAVKISTRDLPFFREPAVILNDQLKQIYIDGEIEPIDTTIWFPKIMRKDYSVGMNLQQPR